MTEPTAQAQAMAKVDTLQRSFKVLWADATRQIFWFGFFIIVIGLLFTVFIPEVPMGPAQKKPAKEKVA